MNKQRLWAGLTAAAVLVLEMSPAQAGSTLGDFTAVALPAPGILGLVALGVVGAIAVAKWRK